VAWDDNHSWFNAGEALPSLKNPPLARGEDKTHVADLARAPKPHEDRREAGGRAGCLGKWIALRQRQKNDRRKDLVIPVPARRASGAADSITL